ncbi:phosphate-binding protein [Sorangium cellulosum]|nr:phosphate-binding protein [Sorangium cellulosum]
MLAPVSSEPDVIHGDVRSVCAALCLWLSALALGPACGRERARGLTLAGSTSLQPFAERWAEAYSATHAGATIHVQGGGSTAGVHAVESGTAQIGMSSRALLPDEATRLRGIVVARDGIAVVVNPENRIDDMTLDEVRRIYAGDVTRWAGLDGRGRRITVITREEGSGTRGAFEELVMQGRRITSAALVQDSTGAVRQMVASDPASIGYISLDLVDASVRPLRIDGVEPTEAAIDAGRYRLVRPFLFVVDGEPTGEAGAFIGWIRGPEGQALTRKEGLLPPAP